MSAAVWPSIPLAQLIVKEEDSLAAELNWLLDLLQENLGSLKGGLQECVDLLAPNEPGTTLALSSLRSETVKGFVTRVGTRIVKGDIRLNLPTLPPNPTTSSPFSSSNPTYLLHLDNPLSLPQLTYLSTALNRALDIIDITLYTGDPRNSSFITAQLKLLSETVSEAATILNGSPTLNTDPLPANSIVDIGVPGVEVPGTRWHDPDPASLPDSLHHQNLTGESAVQLISEAFSDLPPTLAPHFSLSSGALTLTIRTLAPHVSPSASSSPFPSLSRLPFTNPAATTTGDSLRARLGLSPSRNPIHDESGLVFHYKGQEVDVKEKVRVDSLDPGLLAIGAKLGAVSREVEGWRGRVGCVLGEGER